jgi:hypothetical protein
MMPNRSDASIGSAGRINGSGDFSEDVFIGDLFDMGLEGINWRVAKQTLRGYGYLNAANQPVNPTAAEFVARAKKEFQKGQRVRREEKRLMEKFSDV